MTPEQLGILQHALGADEYGRGKDVGHGEFNRNHFCADKADEQTCRDLVALGYMREHRHTELFPYYNCTVTDAGKAAMIAASPEPPKLTRSQKRYRDFLDTDNGERFGEWLKRETRRAAGVKP